MVGCSKEPINYEETLNVKNGVFYTKDTNKPYSGPVFSIHNPEQYSSEGELVDGKKSGFWTYWRESGEVLAECYNKNGNLEGPLTLYYENGNPEVEFNYKNGHLEGTFLEYFKNGQKKKKGTLKNGNYDGTLIGWGKDGSKFEMNYDDGNADGLFNSIDSSQSLSISGKFVNSRPSGEWKYFNYGQDTTININYDNILSDWTHDIVKKLKSPLTIKVFYSDVSQFAILRDILKQTLNDYQSLSEHINISFPNSEFDIKTQAINYGLKPVQMQALENNEMITKKVYLGMVLLYENKNESIPSIQTTAGLEYMISTKIKTLIDIDKKTIGLMNLDKNFDKNMLNLKSQLSQLYNITNIESSMDIPESVDALIINGTNGPVNKKIFSNLRIFLDSGRKICLAQNGVESNLYTQQAKKINSNIFDFLEDYGISLQKNLVIDEICGKVEVQVKKGPSVVNEAIDYPLFPTINTSKDTHIVVSGVDMVQILFPSEIKIDDSRNKNVKYVSSLLKSSNNSGVMESNFNLSPDPNQNPYLSVLGQSGKLLSTISRLNNGGELMLVSDSRFFTDEGGMSIPNNMVFMMNAVDYLTYNDDLISLRLKEAKHRPELLVMQNYLKALIDEWTIELETKKEKVKHLVSKTKLHNEKLKDPYKEKRIEITEFLKKHEMHKNFDTRQFEMISFKKLYQRGCIESYYVSYTFGKQSILKFNLMIAGSNGDYCFYTDELSSYDDSKNVVDMYLDNPPKPNDIVYPCLICE